jgi:hypothetical protein
MRLRRFATVTAIDPDVDDPRADALKVHPIAVQWARHIKRAEPPCVIGVKGAWGTGKSTMVRFAVKALQKSAKEIHVVEFDAWRYRKLPNLESALIAHLAGQIEDSRVDKSLDVIENSLLFALGGFASNILSVKDAKDLATAHAIDRGRILPMYKELYKSISQANDHFLQLSDELIRQKGAKRLLVVVENLDRCLPGDVLNFLEAVQHFLKNKKCIFLIPLDESLLEAELSKQYGSSHFTSQHYLDKILDAQFNPPIHDPETICNYLHTHLLDYIPNTELRREMRTKKASWDRLSPLFAVPVPLNLRKLNRALKMMAVGISADKTFRNILPETFTMVYFKLYYPEAAEMALSSNGDFLIGVCQGSKLANRNAKINFVERQTFVGQYGEQAARRYLDDPFFATLAAIMYSTIPGGSAFNAYFPVKLKQLLQCLGMREHQLQSINSPSDIIDKDA